MAWTKEWGRRPLLDGRSFRELFAWKGVSLWWFAELYLHHSTDAPRHVRVIESVHRILDAEAPDELETVGLSPEDTLLVERTCTARGVLFHGPRRLTRFPAAGKVAAVVRSSRWNAAKALLTAAKARLAGPPPAPPPEPAPTVLFLSHAAFWRARAEGEDAVEYEHYFDRLIPAAAESGLRPFVVAVGPRAAFRRRGRREQVAEWLRFGAPDDPFVHVNRYSDARVHREVRRATATIREGWERLRRSPALADAFSHRGVAFADLAEADLAGTMLLQLPWAVRCYEEMAAVLASVRPAVVCLYAESSGWGRAAVAACRAAGVPTVAIQHGIVYPKYYSYRHAADETDTPVPDATALFGASARRLLDPPRASAAGVPRPHRQPAVRRAAGARALVRPGRAARAAGCLAGTAAGGGGQPLPRHPRHPLRDRQRVPFPGRRRPRPRRAVPGQAASRGIARRVPRGHRAVGSRDRGPFPVRGSPRPAHRRRRPGDRRVAVRGGGAGGGPAGGDPEHADAPRRAGGRGGRPRRGRGRRSDRRAAPRPDGRRDPQRPAARPRPVPPRARPGCRRAGHAAHRGAAARGPPPRPSAPPPAIT